MQTTSQTLQALYLDWVNNFITLYSFAEHHGITQRAATHIIEAGRICHEQEIGKE